MLTKRILLWFISILKLQQYSNIIVKEKWQLLDSSAKLEVFLDFSSVSVLCQLLNWSIGFYSDWFTILLPKIVKRLSQHQIWNRSINVIKNSPLIFMSKFLALKKLGVFRFFWENTEKPGRSVSTEKNVKKFVLLYIIWIHIFKIVEFPPNFWNNTIILRNFITSKIKWE